MPMRRQMQNKGELAVMVVCVVVGFLLAAQLRSDQLAGAADATNASRLETLQNLYNEVVDQKDGLADQVKQLQGELELYREQAASGEAGSEALKAEPGATGDHRRTHRCGGPRRHHHPGGLQSG